MIYPNYRNLINLTSVVRKSTINPRQEIYTDWIRSTKLSSNIVVMEKNRKYISPKQFITLPGWVDVYIRNNGKDKYIIKYNPNSITSKRNEHIEYSDLGIAYIYDVPYIGEENDITIVDTLYDIVNDCLISRDNIPEEVITSSYQQLVIERNNLLDIVYGNQYNPTSKENIIVIDYDKYEAIIQSLVTLVRGNVISNTEFNYLVINLANIYLNNNDYINMLSLEDLVPAIKKDVSLKLIRK